MSTNSEKQAKAKLEHITTLVKRLEHIRECHGKDCELSNTEILEGLGLSGTAATMEDRGQYHDEDDIRQAIDECPLEISVRSGWKVPGENMTPDEYQIWLCTGGPAARITGQLDKWQEPETATLEHQDWFEDWTPYPTNSDENSALLTFAQQFYFGG